jgi:hypothetical protein
MSEFPFHMNTNTMTYGNRLDSGLKVLVKLMNFMDNGKRIPRQLQPHDSSQMNYSHNKERI